jgi:hypothetical protein
MFVFRLLLIIVSITLSIGILTGSINVSSSSVGLLNSSFIGVGLLILFAVNVAAHLISANDEESSKRLANRLTLLSLAVPILFIVGAVILEVTARYLNSF